MRFTPRTPCPILYIIYRYQLSLCDGSTIELLADIESEVIIAINKNITIDGKGKTINSTATRAINIVTDGEVTIKNLTVVAKGERAVNVITKPAIVTLDGVNLTSSNYTVNVATSAGAAQVAITNSTLRGLNTVNNNGAGAEITIDKCVIYCDDNNTTQGEAYAALCLGRDAVGGSIAATNTDIYVTEDSDSTKGRNNASGGTVTINGSTDGVDVKYAAIIVGDYYYSFNTVDGAIKYDKTATITLLRDATIATEGTYTIDVNGHELSAAEGYKVTNDGTTWTVKQLIAFYVENNASWSKVNLYAWDSSAAKTKILGEWPGLEMTRVGETNKYYVEIPEEYVGTTINYIINNGSSQTRDLQVKTFAAGYTHTIGDPDPTKITIYLNNNWSVANLKMHTWNPVLWSGQTWDNRRKPDGTITTDWGTYSYWNVDANQIKTDKTGSLLITGDGKQTADLNNVSYAKDVYIEFVYKNNKDSLQILTTPY